MPAAVYHCEQNARSHDSRRRFDSSHLILTACAPQRPKENFSKLAEEFIYTSLANSPVAATQVGYHRHGISS